MKPFVTPLLPIWLPDENSLSGKLGIVPSGGEQVKNLCLQVQQKSAESHSRWKKNIKRYLDSTKKYGEYFSLFYSSNPQLMGISFHSRSQKKKTFNTLHDRAEILSPEARYLIPEKQDSSQFPWKREEHLQECQTSTLVWITPLTYLPLALSGNSGELFKMKTFVFYIKNISCNTEQLTLCY